MAYAETPKYLLGSGDLYMVAYTTSLPADDATFEATGNKLGTIQGGAVLNYKPKLYEIKGDNGTIITELIQDREVTFKTGVIEWCTDNMNKIMCDGTVTEDATKHEKILTVGSATAEISKYALRFVHTFSNGKKLRVTFVGINASGLQLSFQPEKHTNLDAEFKALPQSGGTLLEIRNEEEGSA